MSQLSDAQRQIQELIRTRSPFDAPENERLISKYFSSVPRAVQLLMKYHGFAERKTLDIGSAYGQSLLYWKEDSEGVEIRDSMRKFLEALGRKTHQINVEDGFPGIAGSSFDAIYTNNLIEHLVAPHLFLGRLHAILKPQGLLAIGHPLTPVTPVKQLWQLAGYNGWLQEEHVNFFTPATSRLTLERAGFRVLDQYFCAFGHSALLSKLALPFGIHCLSVCEKIEGYTYEHHRLEEFDPKWAGDLKHFR